MIEMILAGVILGFTLAFMVGPVFFLLIDISLNKGPQRAIQFDLGVIAADILFVALIWVGADFINIRDNALVVFSVGGILIILFGLYNIRNSTIKKRSGIPAGPSSGRTGRARIYFTKGFLMNFLNAGVLAYWITTSLVMKAAVNGDQAKMLAYFISTIAAYFITDLIKIYFAQRLKKKLTDTVLVQIEKVVGIILVAFGVLMIIRGYLNSIGYHI